MATDATGTPTSPDNIPKFNTSNDAPSGLGFNAAMDALQTIITQIKAGTLPSGKIAIAGLVGYPADATKVLKGDGSWGTTGVAPAFYAPSFSPSGMVNWAANTAVYARIFVPSSFAPASLNVNIGTSSGNIDVGIYTDSAGLPGTRLWSRGGVASPGAGQQSVLISAGTPTSLTLTPGTYWLAWAVDNATITIPTSVVGTSVLAKGVAASQGSAYPLPSTAGAAALGQGVYLTMT